MYKYEWPGGTEDPRIVQGPTSYILTYTTYDGKYARLAVASSKDLKQWTKHGIAFSDFKNGKYFDLWSKSGSIVTEIINKQIVAKMIDGKYWMYWGDTNIYMATSKDMIKWDPLEDDKGELVISLMPRKGSFDSRLVESGPPALFTDKGIVLIYNGMNNQSGDVFLADGTYAAGQALFDPLNPAKAIDRSDQYFLYPDQAFEIYGQVNQVCFVEGLALYKGKLFLYYGTADSLLAVADTSYGE